MGGYPTHDGRSLRWRSLYRADTLHRLTAADLERTRSLGIRTVIDLRSSVELQRWGRFAADDEVAFHHIPFFETTEEPVGPGSSLVAADTPEPPPGQFYLAIAAACSGSIARAFDRVTDGDHAVVFHCTAGKDRTGILAALLLSALEVPEEVIVADYELSEGTFLTWLDWALVNDPEAAREMEAAPAWIHSASGQLMREFLSGLNRAHGSVRGYLSHIGISDERVDTLRSRFLD